MSTEWKRNEILVIVDAYDAHIKLYIDEIVQAKGDEDLKKMIHIQDECCVTCNLSVN